MKCNNCGRREATVLFWVCILSHEGSGYVTPELLCNNCLIVRFGMGVYGPSEVPMAMDFITIKNLGNSSFRSVFHREELQHNEFVSSHWKRLLEGISGVEFSESEPKEPTCSGGLNGSPTGPSNTLP